ncbi:MAG: L,D-transpeptidase [bacterium]|nr:L,D-transpeptidase [bacterium]
MKLKPSLYEKSWLRLLGMGALVIASISLVLPILPSFDRSHEPLAEAESLKRLIQGEILAVPEEDSVASFHSVRAVPPRLSDLLSSSQAHAEPKLVEDILGDTTYGAAKKFIEVDLTNQRVYALRGNRREYEFTVSTGKWAYTPTGIFSVWSKVRSQKMSGGDPKRGTYYYLPNVPYVMFFYNDDVPKMRGFSFHGTYWHENFGHPMSHGCINMKTADAKLLYEWATPDVADNGAWSTLADAANPGTKVIIYGETPIE